MERLANPEFKMADVATADFLIFQRPIHEACKFLSLFLSFPSLPVLALRTRYQFPTLVPALATSSRSRTSLLIEKPVEEAAKNMSACNRRHNYMYTYID